MRIRRTLVGALAVGSLSLGLTGAAAVESDTGDAAQMVEETLPMTFGGFNAEVAAANGFEVVTNPDGTQSSNPVTSEAKKQIDSSIGPFGTVPGSCGTSTVSAVKLAGDTVAYHTGYSVPFPVYERSWRVNIQSITGWNAHPSWGGPTAANWYTEGTAWIVGPGVAVVPVTAFVTASNGRTCYSGGPTASFG